MLTPRSSLAGSSSALARAPAVKLQPGAGAGAVGLRSSSSLAPNVGAASALAPRSSTTPLAGAQKASAALLPSDEAGLKARPFNSYEGFVKVSRRVCVPRTGRVRWRAVPC